MKLYGIIGAGGFGREVMPLADAMLRSFLPKTAYTLVFVDDRTDITLHNDYPVMSFPEFFAHSASEKYFNISITDWKTRQRIADKMLEQGISPFRINAPNFVELSKNHIDIGAIFCSFTNITSNAKIGKFFHANIYSYIAHDCIIGDYVTFAPNVNCNGNVIIEDFAYIGTGVIIKQGTPENPLIIGKGAIVGMGAVVTKNVPAYTTVVGNPARPFEQHKQANLSKTHPA